MWLTAEKEKKKETSRKGQNATSKKITQKKTCTATKKNLQRHINTEQTNAFPEGYGRLQLCAATHVVKIALCSKDPFCSITYINVCNPYKPKMAVYKISLNINVRIVYFQAL